MIGNSANRRFGFIIRIRNHTCMHYPTGWVECFSAIKNRSKKCRHLALLSPGLRLWNVRLNVDFSAGLKKIPEYFTSIKYGETGKIGLHIVARRAFNQSRRITTRTQSVTNPKHGSLYEKVYTVHTDVSKDIADCGNNIPLSLICRMLRCVYASHYIFSRRRSPN